MCNSRPGDWYAPKKWSMQENRYNNSEQMIQVKIRYIYFKVIVHFKKLQWSFIVFERIGYWHLLIYRFTGLFFMQR